MVANSIEADCDFLLGELAEKDPLLSALSNRSGATVLHLVGYNEDGFCDEDTLKLNERYADFTAVSFAAALFKNADGKSSACARGCDSSRA